MQPAASIIPRNGVRPDRPTLWLCALILLSGISGVIADSLRLDQFPVLNLHLVFGVSLSVAVGVSLLRLRREFASGDQGQYFESVRRLSRWVYILLYGLAAVRLGFHLAEILRLSSSAHLAKPHSMDDFQIYIAYALIPLWAMRFLTVQLPDRLGRQSSSSG